MKHIVLIAVFSWNVGVVLAQEMTKENQLVIAHFIENVKHRNKEDIGKKISFPFKIRYPLPVVNDLSDFVRRYDEIFDSSFTREIVNSKLSDWTGMGYHGIMLFDGDLWLDREGGLEAINRLSVTEIEKRDALIEQEKKSLHPSIRNFAEPVFFLETSRHRIRVDDLGDSGYRYASWPLHSKISAKPALILENGEYVPDGGGNGFFRFKRDDYLYECSIIVIGEDSFPPARLIVSKGGKVILSEDAKRFSN